MEGTWQKNDVESIQTSSKRWRYERQLCKICHTLDSNVCRCKCRFATFDWVIEGNPLLALADGMSVVYDQSSREVVHIENGRDYN